MKGWAHPHIYLMSTHQSHFCSRAVHRVLLAVGIAGALALPAAPAAGLGLPSRELPAATVLSARALPGALAAKGGTVEVVGKVRDASSCRLAVLGDHGIKISLPKPANCAGGSYREPARFGPNGAKAPVVVKLGLFAGPAHGVFYVVVAPARPARPAVLSAKAAPWRLGYKGGTVTVEGRVSGAKVCRLAVLDDPGVRARLPKPTSCSKGVYREQVTFGPNRHHEAATVKLALFPYGLVKKYDGAFFVSLAGKPRPKPVPTTTTTPPPATTTPPTTQPLATSGGSPPPSPLPPLPPATTTTAPSTTTTTAPPATTLTAAASTVQQEDAYNWSGYVVNGPQPYTSATGTFTVTGLTSSSSCNDIAAEWVGIDGASSSDTYLIQAGVTVYVDRYANGQCDSGHYGVYPWWEVITPSGMPPAAAIINWDQGPLAGSPATVNIGDQVTVTIGQVADSACSPATECWQMEVVDNTTGGAYTIDEPYAGPGSSAEWIVEDPDQSTNPNCSDYNGVYLCPMPDYTPPVQFSGLSASPNSASGWTDVSLVTPPGCENNCAVVSQPSALSTAPSLGFSVSYVSSSAQAPIVGPLLRPVASELSVIKANTLSRL